MKNLLLVGMLLACPTIACADMNCGFVDAPSEGEETALFDITDYPKELEALKRTREGLEKLRKALKELDLETWEDWMRRVDEDEDRKISRKELEDTLRRMIPCSDIFSPGSCENRDKKIANFVKALLISADLFELLHYDSSGVPAGLIVPDTIGLEHIEDLLQNSIEKLRASKDAIDCSEAPPGQTDECEATRREIEELIKQLDELKELLGGEGALSERYDLIGPPAVD